MSASSREIVARRFRVSGRVQGVGFRYFALHWALQLQLKGYVMNLPDGDVEVYAVGSTAQLGKLREKLERGPAMARVVRIDEAVASVDADYTRFQIEEDNAPWKILKV